MNTVKEAAGQDRELAHQLKSERLRRNWSIDDLARISGVSRAMISKVERGESSPTAAILGRLSAAFGLTMSQLMARSDVRHGHHLRAGEQLRWVDPETGFTRRNLTPQVGPTTPLELVWGELPPRQAVSYPTAAYAFIDDQQVVVLEGRLRVQQGRVAYDLEPGDCLRLGPPDECRFDNPGRRTCRYIVAVLRAW